MKDLQQAPPTAAENWEEIADGLLEIESLSLEMVACPEEALPQKMARRAELIERIQALQAACETCEAPQDDARYLAARDTARAAACRVREIDRQVILRMKSAQQKILEKLRAVGKSAGARASRYYQAQPSAQPSLFHGSI